MTVIIPKEAYKTVVAASVRFANLKLPQEKWLEASGVFIGTIDGDDVIVSKAYPIMHEEYNPDAVVDKYVWSDEDHMSLAIIDDEAFSRNQFTLGWWHSHPGFKVMLSGFGDRKTTMSFQISNPLAIALVFNPLRLMRQLEMPEKKGDPVKGLKNDPGFKIFRLDDPNNSKSNFHEVDYQIKGYESREQLVKQTQKFVVDITNFLPQENVFETYQNYINKKITELNSKLLGTEEYLKTLVRKRQRYRIQEVLENQMKEIKRFVAQTYIDIENIKEFLNYLEFKERVTVIPKVKEVLSEWDEVISNLDKKFEELGSKF